MSTEIKPIIFWVPGIPPTVNHYKTPIKIRTRTGEVRESFAITKEAEAYRQTVAIFARGRSIAPAFNNHAARKRIRYGLCVTVFLGKGDRGDGDNFWKCLADALAHAHVIHSDARVKVWHMDVVSNDRDNPANPRHLICVFEVDNDSRTWAEQMLDEYGESK